MKKVILFVLLFVGIFIGLLLSWQFRSNAPTDSSFPVDELQAKESLLKEYLDEQSYLQSRIIFYRNEIEKAENEVSIHTESSNIGFLENLKRVSGLTAVRGKGIEILVSDGPLASRQGIYASDVDLVQAADLRDIVNILNAANADGVAINNQRIIATSPISSVGTTILVNNFHTSPPFTISAVGDVDLMVQRLQNDPLLTSIYERIGKNNLTFQISIKEWLTVPVYNGDLKINYINLVE